MRGVLYTPKRRDEEVSREVGVTIQKTSMLLREQWYYDDTFLGDDERGYVLFVRHFAEYVTKAGNVHRRRWRGCVGDLPDLDAVEAWIVEHHAVESGDPDGEDRAWVPDEWAGAVAA